MTGCSEHILGSPLLDNSPRIHHADATAHIGNETEIVTDHQNGRSPLGTKIADEVDDFSLDRDVQCCRRLVREQQVRAARQRNGDHDPLAHASRQLMRIILDPPLRRRNAYARERLYRLPFGILPGRALVEHEHFGDLAADRGQRVERRHRLLENHRDAVASELPNLRWRKRLNLAPVEPDGPPADAQRVAQQPDERQRRDALAAAGFPHEAHRLAAPDRERHVLYGSEFLVTDRKIDPQILDFEKGRLGHARRLRDCGSRMSRRPSPRRFRPSTVMKMARPGKIEIHGAVVIWSRASDNMLPQLGKGGRIPNPRNESDASASTAPPMPSVPMTMIGPSILGRSCVSMILMSP